MTKAADLTLSDCINAAQSSRNQGFANASARFILASGICAATAIFTVPCIAVQAGLYAWECAEIRDAYNANVDVCNRLFR